jgi:hypothetical protein
MARFLSLYVWVAVAVGAAGALWPSCAECETSVRGAQQGWRQAAPELLSELPAALCYGCSVPELCRSVVGAVLEQVNATVAALSAPDVCAELQLCNFTEPFLI